MAQAALVQNTDPAPAPVVAAPPAPEPIKTVKMELVRNYVPRKLVSIVGYKKPEKSVKNAAGQVIVLQKEEWVDGEMKPHDMAGVGYTKKIWAGTVIEVPEDEGRQMRANKIAEVYL